MSKMQQWLADLLRHGLVRGSLIPPLPQRDLRDLTRQRTTLIRECASVINRLQKVLEWANIKLASVVRDVSGLSVRAMLKAIVAGTTSPQALASPAKGRLCGKQAELARLNGQVRDHHRALMQTHLEQLEFLDQQVAQFDQRIEQLIETQPLAVDAPSETNSSAVQPCSWQQAMFLLDTIPGVARQSAELLLAEVVVEMHRFQAAHLCKWAGVCPGNHQSAGKQSSGKTPPSNRWLRGMLVQMANATVRSKSSYFATVYRRIAARRGHKRAILAVAHRLLIAVYQMLKQRQPYRDYQATPTGQQAKQQRLKQLQKRVEALGYQVQLVPLPATNPSG